MKKEADKPKSYARTLIEVKRIHGEGLPGFRAMDVVVPKFTIGQDVWLYHSNKFKEHNIKCPVCKEQHVERRPTPFLMNLRIKEVHLFVDSNTVKIRYSLYGYGVAGERLIFLTHNDALKHAREEIKANNCLKLTAKEIAVVKAGIKNYRANIRK